MFEEMRQAGLAGRLVGGADLVPDHVGDDRGAMIGDHHDFKPIVELEIADRGRGLRARRKTARRRAPGSALAVLTRVRPPRLSSSAPRQTSRVAATLSDSFASYFDPAVTLRPIDRHAAKHNYSENRTAILGSSPGDMFSGSCLARRLHPLAERLDLVFGLRRADAIGLIGRRREIAG